MRRILHRTFNKLALLLALSSLLLLPFSGTAFAIGTFDASNVTITPSLVQFDFANAAGTDGFIGFSNIYCADTDTIVAHAATDNFSVNYATGNTVSYAPVGYDPTPHSNCFLRIYSNAGAADYQSLQTFGVNMGSAPDWMERVSVTSSEETAGATAYGTPSAHGLSLSDDGRFVSFYSANNDGLLDGQQGASGIYLRDRLLGTTTLVSVGTGGQQANRLTHADPDQDLSHDAQRLMFMSASDNLDPLVTDGESHCYVRDLTTGVTQLVSITPSGAVSKTRFCAMSDDGNVIAFMPLVQAANIFVRNLQTNTTTQLPYTVPLTPLSLSFDGRYIAFDNDADAVVYDNVTGTTTVASVNMIGGSNDGFMHSVDSISADGRYVFFQSSHKLTADAPSTCDPFCSYRRDMVGGVTTFGHSGQMGVFSRDGTVNVYMAGQGDIYKHDFAANTTELIVPYQTWQNTPSAVVALDGPGALMGLFTAAFGSYPQSQAYVTSTEEHSLPPTDTTPPVVGQPSWTVNPLQQGQNTTLSVTASDNSGTVAQVHYAVEGGQPQSMTYNEALGVWQATFGASLTANTYNVDITAIDPAGNSATTNDILAIYNPANGYVTGHAKIVPTAIGTMPIALDTANNPTKLNTLSR